MDKFFDHLLPLAIVGGALFSLYFFIARPLAAHVILWKNRAHVRSIKASLHLTQLPRPERDDWDKLSWALFAFLFAGIVLAGMFWRLDHEFYFEVWRQSGAGTIPFAAAAWKIGVETTVMVTFATVFVFAFLILRWGPKRITVTMLDPGTILIAEESAPPKRPPLKVVK